MTASSGKESHPVLSDTGHKARRLGTELLVYGRDRMAPIAAGITSAAGLIESPLVTTLVVVAGTAADFTRYHRDNNAAAEGFWNRVAKEDVAREDVVSRTPDKFNVRPVGPIGGVEYNSMADRHQARVLADQASVIAKYPDAVSTVNDHPEPHERHVVSRADGETTLSIVPDPVRTGRRNGKTITLTSVQTEQAASGDVDVQKRITYWRRPRLAMPTSTIVSAQVVRTPAGGQPETTTVIPIQEVAKMQAEMLLRRGRS